MAGTRRDPRGYNCWGDARTTREVRGDNRAAGREIGRWQNYTRTVRGRLGSRKGVWAMAELHANREGTTGQPRGIGVIAELHANREGTTGHPRGSWGDGRTTREP